MQINTMDINSEDRETTPWNRSLYIFKVGLHNYICDLVDWPLERGWSPTFVDRFYNSTFVALGQICGGCLYQMW